MKRKQKQKVRMITHPKQKCNLLGKIFSIFFSKNFFKFFFVEKTHQNQHFSKKFQFSSKDLIVNFWDFEFVFGAKVIYFSWRIQIRRNFWRALEDDQKSGKLAIFSWFPELSARAKIFADLNSPWKIDDFCTKNEFKILKTRN